MGRRRRGEAEAGDDPHGTTERRTRSPARPNYALQLCARLLDLARDAMSAAGLGDRARLLEQRQRLVMVAFPGGNVSQPHQVRSYARHEPRFPGAAAPIPPTADVPCPAGLRGARQCLGAGAPRTWCACHRPATQARTTVREWEPQCRRPAERPDGSSRPRTATHPRRAHRRARDTARSEEHTSELQSHLNLVCRLLLEKKKQKDRRLVLYIHI